MSKSKSKSRKHNSAAGNREVNHPLYPRCDGRPWDPDGSSKNGAGLKRQFLDAYFRINLAYANLVALRKRWKSRPPRNSERMALREIEAALLFRELLDNRHACRGVVATPVYRDGFTVDVLFSDAHTAARRGPLLMASSSSVHLTFALPGGLRYKSGKTNP